MRCGQVFWQVLMYRVLHMAGHTINESAVTASMLHTPAILRYQTAPKSTGSLRQSLCMHHQQKDKDGMMVHRSWGSSEPVSSPLCTNSTNDSFGVIICAQIECTAAVRL